MGVVVSDENVLCRTKPSLVQRLFFCWLCPVFYWGNKRDLGETDLVATKKLYTSNRLGDALESCWKLETVDAQHKGRVPSLKRALLTTFKWRFVLPFIPLIVSTFTRTIQPVLFAYLLAYWTPNSTTTKEDAILYAILMVICSSLTAFTRQHGGFLQNQLGMSIRVAIASVMYRKILRMSSRSLSATAVGKVVNLMSNDLIRFDEAFYLCHDSILVPFQIAFIIYYVFNTVGISGIIGAAVIVVFTTPLQVSLTKLLAKMRLISATRTDSRIKYMDEIICGIKVIKMYAWEEPFANVVTEARRSEIAAIKKASWAKIAIFGFAMLMERIALFFCILSYTLLGNQITADLVYPLNQYYSEMQQAMGFVLPTSLSNLTEMVVTIGRVQEFLNMEERPDLGLTSSEAESCYVELKKHMLSEIGGEQNKGFMLTEKLNKNSDLIIELNNIEAKWSDEDVVATLKNINLKLKPGQLCTVVGSVGSGKSSLLHLLLKELPYSKGDLVVNGKVSFAAQESWLFPKTVRENIVFGLPYDQDKYKKVCKVCCLEPDFKQFEFSDKTLVGERGASLSGGQKARINLARAVYRDADIYLLDDPLSAVDTKVGRKLYEDCISGYLRGKTTVLVTHQLYHLTTADVIVVLDTGRVSAVGKYQELHEKSSVFRNLLSSLDKEKAKDTVTTKDPKKSMHQRTDSTTSDISGPTEEYLAQKLAPETRLKGMLKFSVLSAYYTAGGIGIAVLTVLFLFLAQATATASDYWLSYWMNEVTYWQSNYTAADAEIEPQASNSTNGQYLAIFAALSIACVLTLAVRTYSYVEMCMRSSTSLHNRMFSTMLTGVMRFFDTNTTGRILNRFSKDMGAVDDLLPKSMMDTLQQYLICFSAIILNAIAMPLTLVPSAVLMIINSILTIFYLKASQSLKRLEGTTKSPIFGLVSTTLDGITTIRASNAESKLIDNFDEVQDMHTNAWNTFLGGGAAYGHYLEVLFMFYMSFLFAFFLFLDLGQAIPVGNVGLAVSQSITMMHLLQHGARNLVNMLAQLISVERILEYTNLKTEENLKEGKIKTPQTWPYSGEIIFNDVNLRYGLDSPPVLKHLSIKIPAGSKVGIVGRTGAGKSSLISALFRFAYIEGSITIDGIDTVLVAKQDLRSRISIIPQEPVLFAASIRQNLDPFKNATDDEIWRALELVELKDSIPALDYKVSEGGSNFSVGQRQLVCLARAILTSNKILLMDEATANVDPQTDSLIQKTIRSQFASCTVLTIAHRLNTIMDSDLVLVMDAGEVSEYDHPYNLLRKPNSKLSSMVRETGSGMADQLYRIARKTFFSAKHFDVTRL